MVFVYRRRGSLVNMDRTKDGFRQLAESNDIARTRRAREIVSPSSIGHFTEENISAGIHSNSMGRNELRRGGPGTPTSHACRDVALVRENGDTWALIRLQVLRGTERRQFTDIYVS